MLPIRDTIPSRNPSVVVWMLVLANLAVFVFQLSLPEVRLRDFFYVFGVVPARYSHPRWAEWIGFPDTYWPFFTHMFLHGSWLHILGNLWTLWIFGDNVEDRMGALRFAAFYVACGIAAGLTHYYLNPHSTLPTVGASGAIAGVMGAYFILFPRARIIAMFPIFFYPLFFEVPAFLYLIVWLFTQVQLGMLTPTTDVGGVAWSAHVGGFVAGIVLHRFFLRAARDYRRLEPDEYGIEGAWVRR